MLPVTPSHGVDSRPTHRRADSIRRLGRRQLLGTVGTAAAIGLAGCTGSGDDGGGDGGDGDGDGDGGDSEGGDAPGTDDTGDGPGTDDGESSGESAPDIACADLTAGYTAYPDDEEAYFSAFEIPTVLADATEVMPVTSQVWTRAVRPLAADGDAQFHLSIMQSNDGQETARGLLDGEAAVTEIEFDGETLTASKLTRTDLSGVEQLRISLPYDDGDGTRYYPFTVQLEVENAPDGEVTAACDAAIDEAARHVIESLHPDPDTSSDDAAAIALSRRHGS